MKKILLILAVMASIASCKTKQEAIQEQVVEKAPENNTDVATRSTSGERERPRRPQVDTEQIIAQLNLTEEQEEAYLKFEEDSKAKRAELRSSAGDDRSAMREKMMAMRAERETELSKIFTAEQLAKYNELMRANRRPRKN